MFDNVDWGIVCFQMTLALISSGIVGAILNYYWNKKAAEKDKAFEKEISGLKAKLDSGTYVTNIQYEKEFQIYQEIWDSYYECCIFTYSLYNTFEPYISDEKEKYELQKEKYNTWSEKYNLFYKKYNRYRPFYNDGIYHKFEEAREIMHKVAIIFKSEELRKKNPKYKSTKKRYMSDKNDDFVYNKAPEKMKALEHEICIMIKDYLSDLKLK